VNRFRQVCKAYFALLEVLCQSHQGAIATCDGPTFVLLLQSLDAGLKALDVSVSSQCAAAVDNLASYYFRNAAAAETPSPAGQVPPGTVGQRSLGRHRGQSSLSSVPQHYWMLS